MYQNLVVKNSGESQSEIGSLPSSASLGGHEFEQLHPVGHRETHRGHVDDGAVAVHQTRLRMCLDLLVESSVSSNTVLPGWTKEGIDLNNPQVHS